MPHHRRHLRRAARTALTLGCALLAFVAAAFAGRVVRGALTEPAPGGAAAVTAELGGIRLVADDTWRRATLPRSLAALAAPGSAVYAPVPGLDVRTVIMVGAATDTSLLPAELRRALPASLPRPARDTLLRTHMWRYQGVRMPNGWLVDVSVIPTTAGSLALTCVADPAAWSFALCDAGLRSIDLGRARALAPNAALGAQAALPGAIRDLDARRRALRVALARAPGHRKQALAARRLAGAYGAAARRIAPLASDIGPSGAPRRVVNELRHAGRSYRRLAVTARHARPARYRSARMATEVAERALAASVAGLP